MKKKILRKKTLIKKIKNLRKKIWKKFKQNKIKILRKKLNKIK